MLAPAPQAQRSFLALILGLTPQALCRRLLRRLNSQTPCWHLLRRLHSNESLVVFDAILSQELNELVAKGNLPVVLLLSSNVPTYCFNVRLTYSERTITTLP
jgi:hypothetical protein